MKKLQRQIQLLQVDLESKTKLARELSKFNDEGFEDNITQANDYESFSKVCRNVLNSFFQMLFLIYPPLQAFLIRTYSVKKFEENPRPHDLSVFYFNISGFA